MAQIAVHADMHLYLGESPRTLYLVTSSQEEVQGRPSRALVFRAAEEKLSQAIVEFLPKDEVDLSNAVKLTSRIVKGCLGLISISGGKQVAIQRLCVSMTHFEPRYFPRRYYFRYRDRQHSAFWLAS